MMTKIVAAAGAVVTAAVGVVTNIITDSFTWTLCVSLALLVVLAAALAWWQQGTSGTSGWVRQKARRGGKISTSPIQVQGGGRVIDQAVGGSIKNSKIKNSGGTVKRRAGRKGSIEDSDITVN